MTLDLSLPSDVFDWLVVLMSRYGGMGGHKQFTPGNGYVDEASSLVGGTPITFYVAEDGVTFYVQET